jgi:hypothetical protein
MAIPSSRQSITTADRMDISKCHTLCPYLHRSTRATRHSQRHNQACNNSTVDQMAAACRPASFGPVKLVKVGCLQMCTRCEDNCNQHNYRAACCCPLLTHAPAC